MTASLFGRDRARILFARKGSVFADQYRAYTRRSLTEDEFDYDWGKWRDVSAYGRVGVRVQPLAPVPLTTGN